MKNVASFESFPLALGSCLVSLALLFPVTGLAQGSGGPGASSAGPWNLGLALGHGRRSNPFVASDDADIIAVVDLAWYGERLFFDNGDLGYTLRQTSRFSASALLGFDNERNYFSYLSNGSSGIDIFSLRSLAVDQGFGISVVGEEVDDLSVEELEEILFRDIDSELPDRNFAVNGGLEMLYINPWGDLQAQVFTDLSGTHNGHSAWLSYSYPWFTENSEFSLTLGAEYKSSNLVNYYYGVRAHEALPGRPRYNADAGTNGVVRFAGSRSLNRHWKIVGVLEREYLSSAIKASPIINEDKVDTFYLGLYYQF